MAASVGVSVSLEKTKSWISYQEMWMKELTNSSVIFFYHLQS